MRQKGANLSKRRRNCRKARVRQIERLFQGNRVSAPCRHQTQPKRMIVLQPPLVRHFASATSDAQARDRVHHRQLNIQSHIGAGVP
jgi:hypothetical protein